MKKRLIKNYVVNILLCVIIFSVLSIAFISNDVTPIYKSVETSPIYRGNTSNNNVSIMFNVYENTNIVREILKVLDKNKVNATFFVGGCWADDNIETLKLILKSNNEIGNHGYFHKNHEKLNFEENYNEINNNTKLISALINYKMNLFAPPSGSFSSTTLEVCDSLKYNVIMWSKDTIDWRDSDSGKIIKRATEKLSNGDLILMHPKKHTLDVLDKIISIIKEKGYNIVKVSDNIK